MVLAGSEEGTRDEHGTPHIFDWLALREIEKYVESSTEPPRPYVRVVMSDMAQESRIDPANLRLLKNLEQRNVVELFPIRQEVFTGGEYRKVMIEQADAFVAVGGGKGTYSAGTDMIAEGKTVLPLDLQLGSFVQDGDGSVALHREMISAPERFFPNTHQEMRNRIVLLSLDRGINDAGSVARVSAEMLARELSTNLPSDQPVHIRQRLATVWQGAKALPVLASAIRILEWVRSLLPFV